MVDSRKITVEPLCLTMTGFIVNDIISKEFIAELKKEFPSSIVGHIAIVFTDSKRIIAISHDREEGKTNLKRVNIEGSDPKLISRMAEVLKRVLA